MSKTSNFSSSQFFGGQESSATDGFTPLTSDQMDRLKAGFDLDEIDDDDSIEEPVETGPEPITEPLEGEIGSEDV